MVFLSDIIEVVERLAPTQLALPDDEIGMQVGDVKRDEWGRKNIRSVVVALDPSITVIQHAVDVKAQLLITHHPIFHNSLSELSGGLLQKIRALTSNYISLYVAHTNWDSAENGVNDTLIDLLGLVKTGVVTVKSSSGVEQPLGRLCAPTGGLMSLKLLLEIIKDKLKSQVITYTGELDSEVKKIIVCSGAGDDISLLRNACNMGVDTYITGSASHHALLYSKENNLKLVAAGHYETENPGMKRLSQILQVELPEVKIRFFDSQPPGYCYAGV